jgi:hypothetical protein
MTPSEIRDVNQKRVALYHRIYNWRQAQMVYMPCVASIFLSAMDDSSNAEANERVENTPLYLPSTLPPSLPSQLRVTGLSPGLAEKELRLRTAQADDALADIRCQRQTVTGLVLFKKLHVSGTGQKHNTRIRTLFKRFGNKTERIAEHYRAARKSLEVLDPEGSWQDRILVLRAEDIRGPGREDIDKYDRKPANSEKRREPSWIWLVPRNESTSDNVPMEEHLDASLRVEWSKSRARAARWTEDVKLLVDEMRRVIEFEEWRAGWWRKQAHRQLVVSEHIQHGLVAYAERQAALCECIARGHALHWLPVLRSFDIEPCWASRYSPREDAESTSSDGDDSDNDSEDENNEDTVML